MGCEIDFTPFLFGGCQDAELKSLNKEAWINLSQASPGQLTELGLGFSIAGDQAAGLAHIAVVVEQGRAIGVAEGTTSSQQHRFWSRHVPILRGAPAR